MNNTFSISSAITFGWNQFKGSWKFWLIAYLISFGVATPNYSYKGSQNVSSTTQNYMQNGYSPQTNQTNNAVLGVDDEMPYTNGTANTTVKSPLALFGPMLFVLIPWGIISVVLIVAFAILVVAAGTILKMGYLHLVFDAARNNPLEYKTLLSDVSIKKALRLLLVHFLYFIIVVIGFMFFIIPGIYFALKYVFAAFIFVDKNTGIWESFRQSSQLTKGNKFKLIGLFITFMAMVVLGFLCFFIGIVPASLVISLAIGYVYVTLADGKPEVEASPKIDLNPINA